MTRTIVFFLFGSIALLAAGCPGEDGNGDADTDSLTGSETVALAPETITDLGEGVFTMKVDRIADQPEVNRPLDPLEDADYESVSDGAVYQITFREHGGVHVDISPIGVSGKLRTISGDEKTYNLDNGLLADGRLVVRENNGHFEGEYTVYGSGVPITSSERGFMTWMPQQ